MVLKTFIKNGETLPNGGCLQSPNGQFFAILQGDGYFCVYRGSPNNQGRFVWRTYPVVAGTGGAFFAIMQNDGNFCVYQGSPNNQGSRVWYTDTSRGAGAFFATMQDDGNFCIYQGSGPDNQGSGPDNQGSLVWGALERIINVVPSRGTERDWDIGAAVGTGIVADPLVLTQIRQKQRLLPQQGLSAQSELGGLLRNIAGSNPDDLKETVPEWFPPDEGKSGLGIGWALGDSVLRWHFQKLGLISPAQSLSARYISMAAKETDDYTFRPTTFIEPAPTTLKAALDVVRKFGVVLESELPSAVGSGAPFISEKAFYARAARLKILSYYNLGIDLGNWRTWLRTQGPILASVAPDRAVFGAGPSNGVLDVYDSSTATELNHAVAVVGYKPDDGRFIIRNSWGVGWGDHGYAYVSLLYVLQAFKEAYGVVVARTGQDLLNGYRWMQ